MVAMHVHQPWRPSRRPSKNACITVRSILAYTLLPRTTRHLLFPTVDAHGCFISLKETIGLQGGMR